MGTSYAYAVGNIRAREGALLQKQDMEQLLAAGSVDRFLQILRDKGYGDAASPADDADTLLRQETAKAWHYVQSLSPDEHLFDALLLRNDLHNCKALIKGVLTGKEVSSFLLTPALTPVSQLEQAIKERDFSLLPSSLSAAAERAYEVLAHTFDAQLCDAILDKAALEGMCSAARQTKVPLLIEWVETLVFYTDVKVALRAAKAGKSLDFLKEAVAPLDGIDTEALIHAALENEDAVLEWLERIERFGGHDAAECYRRSPSEFERFTDDRQMRIAKIGRSVTIGAEPLLGYFFAKEAEIKDLNILLSGLRCEQADTAIRERVRELYV